MSKKLTTKASKAVAPNKKKTVSKKSKTIEASVSSPSVATKKQPAKKITTSKKKVEIVDVVTEQKVKKSSDLLKKEKKQAVLNIEQQQQPSSNVVIASNGTTPFVSNGKLIKRKIKRKKPGTGPSKVYFTNETQNAIIAFQKETDPDIREYIYEKKILPAFDSLVENLINVYGFKVQYETKEDLKHEALEALYRTLPKYDGTKNTKAFSYFNVVGRHWLTIQSKQNVKKVQQYISLDDTENISVSDAAIIESFNYVPAYDEVVKTKEARDLIKKIIQELLNKSRTTNEKAVLNAVEDILNNIDNLEFLNKRALLIYVRELSKLSSKSLSMILSNLKKQYKELKKQEDFNY